MRVTFLGTSAGAPTRERGLSAVALRLGDGRVWLVDCGEGTQRRALQERIPLARVDRVLLTHLHGDHCFGLPGLLATQGLQGRREAVEVVGPAGVARWIDVCLETSRTHLPFPLEIRELTGPGPQGSRGALALEAWPLVHRVPSFAYVIREAPVAVTWIASGPGRWASREDRSWAGWRKARP